MFIGLLKVWNYFPKLKTTELYSKLLPVLFFIMQDISHFLTYGKLLAAERLGIELGGVREPRLDVTKFGVECIKRFSEKIGSF